MLLYERISELAKKQGVSVPQLSENLGLSRNAIYQWKTSSPKADTLQKVADYFGVTTDYLLGRDEPEIIEDDKLKVIASHIDDDVTEEDMEEILNFIEFIKSKNK
ncbi:MULTISPECIES: helix-turn-helix domain-containing protein [Carnobacterium]|uniref:helix-turn-helix domain-containing protein n=1 Tax=Carnobacterium TaxID=2747 RepID=UPI0028903016|nr:MULTISPECIES: helix-turn-helix transcriptional regulator [Carnobacterium]MDT1939689.1 helix-turn-helix domain-containing protein [Carnobacterium divergens]MDT1942127.1 helix-turn-helix domain-containing protein [Carnobacterium divergens]MDT1947925.1 helix-turn-helix domain-containing protein [Carnobacterium divergens]MDT1950413.1 helix-turn-helix domain-containing protein [Carnobacterium divergens]MDT1955591.1 helix-turn-helix domain-containing protein [Carnobacterium divergens]